MKESGKSRVYGYTDFDNDALYDKSTESLIAEFPDATTGFELLQQDDRLLAVSDKEIRELLPSPGVLFSDPAGPPTADWDVDNQFIYGNDGLYGEPLTVGPQERIFTRSSNDTFAASSSYAQYESHQLVPVFSLAPVQGETEVLIQGQPGSSFHLYRGTSNPATNAPVAIGTIDSNGFASVTVPTLQFGESLAVSRPGEPAIPFKVWRTADLAAEFQNFFPSGGPGEHWVEMVGHPYLDLDLLTSGNPNGPWIFSSAVNDRPFGVTWQRVPLPPGNEEFFAVGDHGP